MPSSSLMWPRTLAEWPQYFRDAGTLDDVGAAAIDLLQRLSTPPVPEALPESTLRVVREARANQGRPSLVLSPLYEAVCDLADRLDARERENKALRALALRSYKRVDVQAGELVQFLACYVLNWDAHSDPECGFREISEETVAAAIASAGGAAA